MSLGKRQRGATIIRQSPTRDARAPLRRGYVIAGALALVLIASGLLLTPTEQSREVATSEAPPAAPAATAPQPGADANREQAAAVPVPAPVVEIPWHEETVRRGDNLSLIFKRAGYNDRDVYQVVSQASDGKMLERIYPGQTIAFQADGNGALARVRYVKSPLQTITYTREAGGFSSTVSSREPETREAWATGTISSSLFLAGQQAGLSQNMIMEMANIFGGVIDFVLDPRKGDTMQLIYEELYLDGEKFRDGTIVAAAFTNQGETFNAFRYEDSNGDINYYNEDGVSMRKAFLLAPVDFTRISSNFNMRRLHPIYKTRRPHRGTDYAAPTGTPVFAAGDGRVIKAGYTKANGNYVFIQHGEQYVTRYLHLHKRKVKQGQRVSQSQVIGTVGATGAATGPHLHYEFLVDGVHRNPRTIHKQLPKAKSLPASEMPRFREAIRDISTQLAALRTDNRLAMNDVVQADDETP
jgi:murein DD-endopeptidase MepM/ murein hydrolase activator NlpD